jgi:hypothetical protein
MRFDIASILAWDTGLSLQKKKKKNKEQLINVAWDTEKNDLSSLM